MAQSDHLLVAAFDFGTTYSGYAFSFRDDPLKVQTNQGWNAGSERLISLKTPTCVLLNDKKEFHSFGFQAENKYASLAEDNKHKGWLLFRRFKMILHKTEGLSRETTVEDINGKGMPAMAIFTMAIRYLKDHLLNTLSKQTTGVDETDIKYVITVPAIWDASAKQFMREAAEKADIDKTRLKLALEPEAASIWCQIVNTQAKGALAGSGTQYMVLDLGGGTADVSVHERDADGTLKELHKSSGGPWGGIVVDNNYIKWLEKLYGTDALKSLKEEEMADYFDLLREFETVKRAVTSESENQIVLRISAALKEMMEKNENTTLQERIDSLNLNSYITVKRDKMKLEPSVARFWFDDPVNSVIKHVSRILAEPIMKQVNSILLVGGFGESQYVQEKIRTAIPSKRLIVPNEAGLVVLKGAVRFGHAPGIVSARVMTYSFGISTYLEFDKTRHSLHLMEIINGNEVVDNAFDLFVGVGDTVRYDQEVTRKYSPTGLNRTHLYVYRSTDPNPQFTTESTCKLLGLLRIEHEEGKTLKDKSFKTIMIFGDTEIIVKAKLKRTGKDFLAVLDCLK